MSAVGRSRRFDVVLAALALAEERGAVSLADAAAASDVDPDTLRTLLEPVLYLDFRLTARGGRLGREIDESRAFLLTEDDVLVSEQSHWLRDLMTEPPEREVTLHLLTAGLAYRAGTGAERPDLDRAVARLGDALGATVHVAMDVPPMLAIAREAAREGRTLCFGYVKAGLAESADREVEPHRVFCSWGNWYVYGPEVGGEQPKYFRVDRMTRAELGSGSIGEPTELELPDFFDLSDHAVDLELRVPRSCLRMLEADYRVRDVRGVSDNADLVDVELTAYGEATLDHLLLRLPPEAGFVAPHSLAQRRRDLATGVLALYD